MSKPNWLIRVLFTVAFGLAGLAVLEKLSNLFGYTILRDYAPARFLEFAVIVLMFVIALLLRDIRHSMVARS